MLLNQNGRIGGGSRLALRRHLPNQLARALKVAKVEDAPVWLRNGRQRLGELRIDPIVEICIFLGPQKRNHRSAVSFDGLNSLAGA